MDQHLKHKDVRKMIKHNEFQEIIANLITAAKKNTENLIIGAIVVVVIAVAIPLLINSQAKKEEKAQGILAQANYFYNLPVGQDKETGVKYFANEGEKFDRIIGSYSEILQNYKGTKAMKQATLGIADANYAAGKYLEALEYYNTFITKYPGHELADDALSGRAYANYQMGNVREAAADWEEVVKNYKGANTFQDARMRAADCYEKLGEKEKAKAVYTDIVSEGQDGQWAKEARAKLTALK